MKKVYLLLALVLFASADSYRVHDSRHGVHDDDQRVYITKTDDNTYKTSSGAVIKTALCLETAIDTRAWLRHSESSFDNKLIFKNGKTCQVSEVIY
jgi:hypothetical protein